MGALAVAFGVLVICGLGIAWPVKKKGSGCLMPLIAPAAGLIGAVLPLALWWVIERPAGAIPLYLASVGMFILTVSALALVATGWQAVLQPKTKGKQTAAEEKMVDSLVNPFSWLDSATHTTTSTGGDDVIGGCILMIAAIILNVFFVIGLFIAQILGRLLPGSAGPLRRALRVILSMVFALLVYAGGASLLLIAR
jgi:hypothetical protein